MYDFLTRFLHAVWLLFSLLSFFLPSFWLQLVHFPCCLTPYSYMDACRHEYFFLHAPHSFSLVSVFCIPLPCLVKPAVCVYFTWLTSSRRAGCQQSYCHFKSTLTDSCSYQEDYLSVAFTGHGCTARQWVCVHVLHAKSFVPSLSSSVRPAVHVDFHLHRFHGLPVWEK